MPYWTPGVCSAPGNNLSDRGDPTPMSELPMAAAPADSPAAPGPPGFRGGPRTYAGLAALILAFILPVFVIVIPFLALSAKWSALLTTGLLVGGPELLTLIASMFIMGGEFWEKVQRLFIWEGRG